MEKDQFIPAEEFCTYHHIELSFIRSLENSGLISTTSIEQASFIPLDEIQKLEKYVRLHYELDINLEGIETINHLLDKIENLQMEILQLKNQIA